MNSRVNTRATRSSNAAAIKTTAMNCNANDENSIARNNILGKGALLGQGVLKDASNRQMGGLKRKAETNIDTNVVAKKRSIMGDVTNVFEKTLNQGRKEVQKLGLLKKSNAVTKPTVSSLAKQTIKAKTLAPTTGQLASVTVLPKVVITRTAAAARRSTATSSLHTQRAPLAEAEDDIDEQLAADISYCEALPSSQEAKPLVVTLDSSNYVTASEASPVVHQMAKASLDCVSEEPITIEETSVSSSTDSSITPLPQGVEDYDKECELDPFAVALYANDIFNYYKQRESDFVIERYLQKQPDVSESMRTILVDWMVEVQESFELNHETLYLAVKLVDLYLSKVIIQRDELQLVGATSLFIACKFDERVPPYVDDFLYICDDAYKRKEIISYEIKILKAIGYDLGVPLSYRYLRRYARCAKVSMEELTLARYILELSLMEYDLIDASDCAVAAAALLLARCMTTPEGKGHWNPTLQHYSGMSVADITHLVHVLHTMLTAPGREHLKTIRNKYAHEVFYEVAKIPVPETLVL